MRTAAPSSKASTSRFRRRSRVPAWRWRSGRSWPTTSPRDGSSLLSDKSGGPAARSGSSGRNGTSGTRAFAPSSTGSRRKSRRSRIVGTERDCLRRHGSEDQALLPLNVRRHARHAAVPQDPTESRKFDGLFLPGMVLDDHSKPADTTSPRGIVFAHPLQGIHVNLDVAMVVVELLRFFLDLGLVVKKRIHDILFRHCMCGEATLQAK